MKKIIGILLLTVSVNTLAGQELTVNQYLNGIWKLECCDPDFYVLYNNQLFWVNERTLNVTSPHNSYCYPKTSVLDTITWFTRYQPITQNEIYFDRPFHLIDGEEIIEVLYYNKKEILSNGAIKFHDVEEFQIDPKRPNNFIAWGQNNSQQIVYYNRILSPPKNILDFYKKVAPERFKKISFEKIKVFFTPVYPSKMYLLKGNEVEILETKKDWLRIRYYGNKTIEGWIKKSDVE